MVTLEYTCKNGHTKQTYYDNRGTKDCRVCRKSALIKYRAVNASGLKTYHKSWRDTHTTNVKIHSATWHSKKFFGNKREEIIIRDGEKCTHCGMSRVEHKEKYNKDLEINHIDRQGTTLPVGQQNNSSDNLETLCKSCHTKADQRLIWRAKKLPAILQLDKNDNIIARYSHLFEIADRLNIDKRSVHGCLRGRTKTSHGYKWRYEDV